MSCTIKLKNGESSKLHTQLLEIFPNEQEAELKYNYFDSPTFMEHFGFYQELRDNKDVEYIDPNFEGRLNEYYEPKLFSDDLGSYYLDKNHEKQYVKMSSSKISNLFKSENTVTKLINILSSEYIKHFNLDFTTLNLDNLKTKNKLKDVIEAKLNLMADSLLVSNSTVLRQNGNKLCEILDDEFLLLELSDLVKDNFKKNQITIEDEEEIDPDTKDPSFSQSSIEINSKDKVSANIKLRLSMIKDTSKVDTDFNENLSVDYNKLYNKMIQVLSNKVALEVEGKQQDLFEIFVDEIDKFSSIPHFKDISAILKTFRNSETVRGSNEYKLRENLKSEFVRAFRLHSNVYNVTETTYKTVNGKQVPSTSVFDAAANTDANIIKNEFIAAIDNYFFEEDAKFLNKEGFQKLDGVKERLRELTSKRTSNKNYLEDVQILSDILKSVGINIKKEAINLAVNNLKHDKEYTEKYRDGELNKFIKDAYRIFDNLQEHKKEGKDLINIYSYQKTIPAAEAFYRDNGSVSSITSTTKTKYKYSQPTYVANLISSWKTSINELMTKEYYGNAWIHSSKFLNYFLANDTSDKNKEDVRESRLEKLKLSHANVSQIRDEKGKLDAKEFKDLTETEYFLDTIHKLLYSKKEDARGDYKGSTIMRTTTAPGKSTQLEIIHDYFENSGITFENGEIKIPEETTNSFYQYVVGEFGRMAEEFEKLETLQPNEKYIYYHTDIDGNTHKDGKLIGNAFKSQILPSLNFENISSKINFYNEDGSLRKIFDEQGNDTGQYAYTAYESEIKELVNSAIQSKVESTLERLLKDNIIEKINDDIFSNNSLDGSIFNYYSGKINENLSKSQLYNLAGDIFLNGFINHAEYSKMIAGDVAYYKNPTDYDKRIGATYSDGIYQYLNDLNKSYNIAVIDAVNIVEPYKNEFVELLQNDQDLIKVWSEEMNAADAQAWITPERWKSLQQSIKWNYKYDILYDKIKGTNKEVFTAEELKMALQPMKGTYFGINKYGVPTFLKYSQAILIPQLRENNDLQKIYDLMQRDNVHELITIDGIKAGSTQTTKIHDENGKITIDNNTKLNVVTLESKNWKLQQDLHSKTVKQTDIGSQIQKNMIPLLSFFTDLDVKEFEFNGKEYSPREIAEMMDDAQGDLTVKGFQDLYKELGIDENDRIKKTETFYKAIISEYEKKGGNKATIKALKAGLSTYGIPGLKEKFDNIFASIVNDRTVKIKTNGGSFIQMSGIGLSKQQADNKHGDGIKWSPLVGQNESVKPYRYRLDKNGNKMFNILGKPIIESNQILISGSYIAKYIPDYKKYSSAKLFGTVNPETGRLEGGIIDEKILNNIVGYRIPNQGPSSNDALQIAGILPESSGDTIVAFMGITLKTGSDFDIDKMYLMLPNIKLQNDKLKYTFFEVDENGEELPINEQSKEAVQNRVIELYKTTLLHSNNIATVMTPIDFPYIKDDAQNISPPVQATDLGIFDPIQNIKTKYSFMLGELGVGQMANTFSDSAMGSMTDYHLEDVVVSSVNANTKEVGGKTVTHFDKEFSVELSPKELSDYEKSYNTRASKPINKEYLKGLSKVKIMNTLSALMNAFVDIAKDPFITNINWNAMTTNIGNFLMRAGVHPFKTLAFIAQPIIKEYIEFSSMYETQKKTSQIKNTQLAFKIYKVGETLKNKNNIYVINGRSIGQKVLYNELMNSVKNIESLTENDFKGFRVMNIIQSKLKLTDSEIKEVFNHKNIQKTLTDMYHSHLIYFLPDNFYDNAIDVELKVLRNNIFNTTDEFQADILNSFFKLLKESKKMKANIDASKHSVNGMGKNTVSLLATKNKVLNVRSKGVIGYENKMKHPSGKNKLLGHYNDGLDKVINIIQANPNLFISANNAVWRMFNMISKQIYNETLENEELGKKLENNFYSYMMSGFDPLVTTHEERVSLIKDFPSEFIEFKLKHGDRFELFNEISVNKSGNDYFIGAINKKNDEDYNGTIINSWDDLMRYYPEFSNKLIKYSFLTSGFKQSTTSFFKFIPPNFFIQNGFNNYLKQYSKELNEIGDISFIDQFYLANLEDKSIVKSKSKFSIDRIATKGVFGLRVIPDITDNFISIDETPDGSENPVINHYKFIGVTMKGSNVYSQYIKTNKGYVKIENLVEYKGKGFAIHNYSKFAENMKIAKLTESQQKTLDLTYDNINERFLKDMEEQVSKVYEKPIDENEIITNQTELSKEKYNNLSEKENKFENKGLIRNISSDYGVVKVETNPSFEKTKEFVNLIAPQVTIQTYKENKGKFANEMFHYGLMWARKKESSKPVNIKSYEKSGYYAYHNLDQNGNVLPSISVLQPIIDEIQNNLKLDMTDYDSVIGNIYLDGQYVYPHKDTTESISARKYPVIVYTIGNDAGLGIVDNNDGKMTFANEYDTQWLPNQDKLKGYTNELKTKNGSIYTFGLEGNGRFELTHSTPIKSIKKQQFPPLILPSGQIITNYTITLTFRRAQDLTTNIKIEPKKLNNFKIDNSELNAETIVNVFNNYSERINNKIKEREGLFGENMTLEQFKQIIKEFNSKEELIEFIKKCY